jgi:lipoate-protein ligase A
MAVDEALLEEADAHGIATLRCYRWSTPTLSLGYFQRADDRRGHRASFGCPMVRRASGGGAILHDRELTYSLVLPMADRLSAAARGLHGRIHAALAEALAAMGIAVRICDNAARGQHNAFLCFKRHAPGDLLLDDAKIAGSAQRRHRGAIVQHGSILLAASNCAPELAGLAELTGRPIDALNLANEFRQSVCRQLNLRCADATGSHLPLPNDLRRRAEEIAQEKFATAAWTNRR